VIIGEVQRMDRIPRLLNCHQFRKGKNRIMKINALFCAVAFVIGVSNTVQAGEYICKVYCNSGSTSIVVTASSSSDAAKKIDPTPVANQICKDAGKGNASSSTMGSSQCSSK
jgi:hypothetical protein